MFEDYDIKAGAAYLWKEEVFVSASADSKLFEVPIFCNNLDWIFLANESFVEFE